MWIISADYVTDYKIKVVFENNSTRIIDLKPFIQKSKHPSIKKFLDKDLFRLFNIEYGSLCWTGGQFDISHQAIYNGDFDVKRGTKTKKHKKEKV